MKSIPERAIETRTLVNMLREVVDGEAITYDKMSQAVGMKVTKDGAHFLQSARRILLNNENMVFEAVRGSGLKKLMDQEIVRSSRSDNTRIHRIARKATKKLASVKEFGALPNELKVQHNTMYSLYGALSAITSQQKIKKLELTVEKAQAQLPLMKTLEAFRTL